MSQTPDLKTLAQRAYLSYHQDGIIDLLIGWMAFAFGLLLSFDTPAIALLAWFPLLSYVPIKNVVAVPRLEYVQFGAEYGLRQRKHLGTILLVGAILLVRFIREYPPAQEGMDHDPA